MNQAILLFAMCLLPIYTRFFVGSPCAHCFARALAGLLAAKITLSFFSAQLAQNRFWHKYSIFW